VTIKRVATERFSLARWSRRKLQSAMQPSPAAAPATIPATAPPAGSPPAPVELPPIESLNIDSDFTVFLRPEVDETLKRAALKQLFRDPRFNVMDGLDTYIDDYTKADPIPPDMLAELLKRFDVAEPAPPPVPSAQRDAQTRDVAVPSAREEAGEGRSLPSERAREEPDAPASAPLENALSAPDVGRVPSVPVAPPGREEPR
jgi:Protein of unknown function (DUF3306)